MPIFNISKRRKKSEFSIFGASKGTWLHEEEKKKKTGKGNMLRLYVFSLLFQNDVVSC
jgi:predicted transcriptional regulator